MQWVPLRELVSDLERAAAGEAMMPLTAAEAAAALTVAKDMQLLHEATDKGALVFSETPRGYMLRFASPLLCALVQQRAYSTARNPPWFSAYARLCLLYPYGTLGIDAAEYVRRSWHATGRVLASRAAVLSAGEYSNRVLRVTGTGDAAEINVDGIPVDETALPGLPVRGVQLKEEPNVWCGRRGAAVPVPGSGRRQERAPHDALQPDQAR